MSQLRMPVKDSLREPIDDVAEQRMWRGVSRRRTRVVPGAQGRRTLAGLTTAVALTAVALLVALLVYRARTPAVVSTDAGPVRLADGSLLAGMLGGDAAATFTLSDGSIVTTRSGARLEVLESSGTVLAFSLRGGATFDVQPRGPRRWSIECDAATVEVVGTRFTLESSPGQLTVEVEHGVVLVRGEKVPNRVAKLVVGETLTIGAEALPTGAPASPGSVAPLPTSSVTPLSPSSAPSKAPMTAAASVSTAPASAAPLVPIPLASDAWRDLAQRGVYADAYSSLGVGGVRRSAEHATVDDLLTLADVARLSGHAAEAVYPLTRVMTDLAGDPRASLAGFTLGRLELDTLGDAAGAADAFSRAIGLGLPAGLVEDAYARLVEARARAGDHAGARTAADAYEKRFPGGSRASSIRRWLTAP